jgi:hypothetical protein
MKRSPLLVGCLTALGALLNSPAPALANWCHLSWDIPCCPDPCGGGFAVVTLTICNTKQTTFDYQFDMSGPAGVMFMPPTGIVGLAPGECINLPITVKCPPGLGNFIFSATITKFGPPPVETFTCDGSIRTTGGIKAGSGNPTVSVNPVLPTRVSIMVQAPQEFRPAFFDIFYVAGGPLQVNPPMQRLQPPPGTGAWAVDSFFDVFYDIDLTDRGLGSAEMGDVIIMGDIDGDGTPEPIGSVGVMLESAGCAADLNGDGIVDTADLGLVLSFFGQMCF